MSHKNEHANALMELWGIVLRYRWRFILPAFVVATTVLSVSIFLPRKYKAVGIFERRTDMVLTEMSNSHQGATKSFQNPRDSIVEEISGPTAVDHVIKELEPKLVEQGLIRSRLDLERLREDLLRRVVVRWDISNYQIDRIRVEFVGSNPQLASTTLNALVESYIERAENQMRDRLLESSSFFNTEVARSRTAIEKLEADLLDFEIKHGDLLPENPNNLQNRVTDSQDKLADIIATREAARTRVDALTRALKDVPQVVPTLIHGKNPELTRLEGKLQKTTDLLAENLNVRKMTAIHPDVIALEEQIAVLHEEIAQTEAEVVTERQFRTNPKRAELELQLTTAISEHQAVVQQAASLQHEVDKMNAAIEGMYTVRSTHRQLSRDLSEAQRQLAFWENNLRRVEMASAAESGERGIQMEYVKPATASLRPVSPNLSQVLMGAVGLGLLCGGLAVFIAHRTDETFVEGKQLSQHFNIPLFGSVSELITQRHRRFRRLQRFVLYPANAMAMATILITIATVLYVDLESPRSPAPAIESDDVTTIENAMQEVTR